MDDKQQINVLKLPEDGTRITMKIGKSLSVGFTVFDDLLSPDTRQTVLAILASTYDKYTRDVTITKLCRDEEITNIKETLKGCVSDETLESIK